MQKFLLILFIFMVPTLSFAQDIGGVVTKIIQEDLKNPKITREDIKLLAATAEKLAGSEVAPDEFDRIKEDLKNPETTDFYRYAETIKIDNGIYLVLLTLETYAYQSKQYAMLWDGKKLKNVDLMGISALDPDTTGEGQFYELSSSYVGETLYTPDSKTLIIQRRAVADDGQSGIHLFYKYEKGKFTLDLVLDVPPLKESEYKKYKDKLPGLDKRKTTIVYSAKSVKK